MGGLKTPVVLLVVAAIFATALSACGGGDDSTSSTASTEAGTETAEAPKAPTGKDVKKKTEKKGPAKKAEGGQKSSDGRPTSSGGGDPKGGPEPATNFETPGGDNSIQEYGDEGDESEREEATIVVNALFKATRTGNWNEVCGKYLSKSNVEQLEMLAEKAPQAKGKDCAGILGGLNSQTGASPSEPVGEVGSVRNEEEVTFAIYRGKDGKGYAIPLKREGGDLKLTALAPTPLGGP
jgi:hypothetical protein